jgi:hypothetical protein
LAGVLSNLLTEDSTVDPFLTIDSGGHHAYQREMGWHDAQQEAIVRAQCQSSGPLQNRASVDQVIDFGS